MIPKIRKHYSIFNLIDDMLGGESFFEFNGLEKTNDYFLTSDKMATDICEDEKNYYVDIEVTGFSKNNISIEYKEDVLLVKLHKDNSKEDIKNENVKYYRKEIQSQSYMRCYKIFGVDENKINADIKDGILHIILEKKENKKSKKIGIG